MFAYLGNIAFGVSPLTGPTAFDETYGNTFARHDVIRGKPVLQLIGEELDTKNVVFFFDETFCNPGVEWLKLWSAYKTKAALPLVAGVSFDGKHFVVETLERGIQKTSRSGRKIVRLEATMSLIESPVPDLLTAALSAASSIARGLGSASTKPDAQR
ncbi:MAG TPA: phage tail protein [Ancylobacter sp.]